MRIYLAGPMSGLPAFNYPAFNAMAARLREAGYEVENPAENPDPEPATWENYLRTALRQMLTCDCVALLEGWESSKGARLEIDVAGRLSIPIKMADTIPVTCIAYDDSMNAIRAANDVDS